MATKKAVRKTAPRKSAPVKVSGVLVGQAKEFDDLKRELRAALEFMKEEGITGDLCDEGKEKFASLAKKCGAQVSTTYSDASLTLRLDNYELPIAENAEQYLSSLTVTLTDKDGKKVNVNYMDVDYEGDES